MWCFATVLRKFPLGLLFFFNYYFGGGADFYSHFFFHTYFLKTLVTTNEGKYFHSSTQSYL